MKKIGFVTPWFGIDIPGGAEAELRGWATHLLEVGQEVEVLTTCVKDFSSDWNENYHKEGFTIEGGIGVRRFKIRKRDTRAFDKVNYKIINNQMPLTDAEEQTYVNEMINSPGLYKYIKENEKDYSLFVFIPYMFGTTYFGMQQVLNKSVLIPCFHDESYIYMRVFKKCFSKAAGMIFNSLPECDLAHRVYELSNVYTQVIGIGIDIDITFNASRFRAKYGINTSFILYAGRKDSGKNVDLLIKYFANYKERHNGDDIHLVLIGGGQITIPESIRSEVIDLGFVDPQDKYDAYAAADVLCQPSKNESFSLVIMESWLCERPVLVHGGCAVTKNFVQQSNGGLYFNNYLEFEGCLDYMLQHQNVSNKMGRLGHDFVVRNFSWSVIVKKIMVFFRKLDEKNVKN